MTITVLGPFHGPTTASLSRTVTESLDMRIPNAATVTLALAASPAGLCGVDESL